MRIAITGATGNVGSSVVRRLLADGHELTGVVRRPPDTDEGPYAEVAWTSADLATDGSVAALREAFAGVDAVVHLAWGFQPSHRLDYLEELGVGGTERVLTAVAAAGVAHLVHLSSVGAYSPKQDDEPVTEDYPTDGVPTSPYSQHKAAAERLLDTFGANHPGTTVTRLRPGIVGQERAGSSLLRYALPAAAPSVLLRLLPVLPVDRSLAIPMVHADDVAAAVALAIAGRVPGAFNLAAPPVVTVDDVAAALGARHVHLPARVLRGAVAGSWHARLQPLDPGWIDLAFAVPLLDCTRAERELGWTPTVDARATLQQIVDGMATSAADATPSLRPRRLADLARRLVTDGPVTRRRQP